MTRNPDRIDPVLTRIAEEHGLRAPSTAIDLSQPHESWCEANDHSKCSPAYDPAPMPAPDSMHDIICAECKSTIGSSSAGRCSYRCSCGYEYVDTHDPRCSGCDDCEDETP
jgi:hypothetical protein